VANAERRAAIRGRLDASFAVIDGLTLSERQRVQAAANAAGLAVGERQQTGTGGATTPRGGATLQGDFDGEAATASYAIPADIPSGDDDDVVARQLREAAMREADPELRAKLWDEYRNYIGLRR
jgi:hypothetical protein